MSTIDVCEAQNLVRQPRRIAPGVGRYLLEPAVAFLDGFVIFFAGLLSAVFYHRLLGDAPAANLEAFSAISLLAALLFMALTKTAGGYDTFVLSSPAPNLRQVMVCWCSVFLFLTLIAFLLKISASFSRGAMITFAISGALALLGHRIVWRKFVEWALANSRVFVTNVAIVRRVAPASPERAQAENSWISQLTRNGLIPVAQVFLHSNPDTAVSRKEPIDTLVLAVSQGLIDEIVVVMDSASLYELPAILEQLRIVPVPVRCILDEVVSDIASRPCRRIGSVVLAQVQREPLSLVERAAKRMLDLVIASLALISLSPLLLMVALSVKIGDHGAIFFTQRRRGVGGRLFRILKFRSMTTADDGDVIVQAKKNDARVTRIGRILRSTSIDELPQLLNVLHGEMSIVGPRPHAVAHDTHYGGFIEEYAFRHHTKPGLTGWAQIHGLRGETANISMMRQRVEKDIWYIDNWGLLLDLRIIVQTCFVIFRQKTAY